LRKPHTKTTTRTARKHERGALSPADQVYELRCHLSADPRRPLSQQRLSHLLGVSWSTVARWEGGGQPDVQMTRKLTRIDRVLELIGDMVKPEDRVEFLEQHHPLLLNLRPIDLLDSDNGEKAVVELLEGAATGSFA